ncbi:MAG: penicillin-binding protein 2 [Anaerolineae bacterium]|nr:penicillin-binding protein 2 [Anaerolineae bacterium]
MQNQEMFKRRLQMIGAVLIVFAVVMVMRLITIQFQMDPEDVAYFQGQTQQYTRLVEYLPTRGQIYDRDGELFAVNKITYEIGANPPLISDPVDAARKLAATLDLDELAIYEKLISGQAWVLIARPVSAAAGQAVQDLDIFGVEISPIPDRDYPQGMLGAQVIGFVGGEQQGNFGVEGAYERDLAGESLVGEESAIPFQVSAQYAPRHGRDLVLTLDRDIQFLAESELLRAIDLSGAERGTILIMNPRTGAVLAMANYPSYDPNTYYEVVDARLYTNAAISEQYEPGSVFKVVTMAAAIEAGVILPGSTYNDQANLECGGITIWNWDRTSHGLVDMTQVMVQSLNVGTSTVAKEMGPTRFYNMLNAFGFGQLTRIDLQGEASGTVSVPGDTNWQESQLCTNSFGQGVAVTPLQMLTAVNAIANGGLMMQPHVVHQIIEGENVYTTQPSPMGRPVSTQTANMVRDMMVQVVQHGVPVAQVPGYTIAGKTGTAQIPIPGGYDDEESIVSFVGFLPADAPQVSVLIKLDRPIDYWGSVVAAPIFSHLVERLVIMLEIPPDNVRLRLASDGGRLDAVDR